MKNIIILGSLLTVTAFTAWRSYNASVVKVFIDTLPRRDSSAWPKTFGLGRTATQPEITAWDIDIRPDGKGLPVGSGTPVKGKLVYQTQCAACHGPTGRELPNFKLPAPVLVSDTVFAGRKSNTIGNYWPYATTLFDYIRRSMPFHAPGSLTNEQVYSVTAYLLSENKIITADKILDEKTLPQVLMPAKKYFITDDRKGGPEVK